MSTKKFHAFAVSKKPLTIDNIPLEDIESALEAEMDYSEGCSTMSAPVPPNKAADIDRKSAVFSFVNVDFESLLCQSLHFRGIISKRGQI